MRSVITAWTVVLLAGCVRPAPSALPAAHVRSGVWVGGDVHLADSAWSDPLGLSEPGFVNLEGPVREDEPWTEGGTVGQPLHLFNGRDAVASLAPGIHWVGIANNHAGDAGPEGRAQTAAALRRAGLEPVDGLWRGSGLQLAAVDLGAPDESDDDVAQRVRDALSTADDATPLLVAFHLTDPEPSYFPSARLRAATDLAIEAGADLVVSHGTHLIGPVEVRGTTVIVWGLGNLVFHCECTHETDALVVRWRGDDSVELLPVTAGLSGEPARRAPPEAMVALLRAIGSTHLALEDDGRIRVR